MPVLGSPSPQPINPTGRAMNLTLPFAELPSSRLCVAGAAFGNGTAGQGAAIEGAPPGVPVQQRSSA